MSYTELRCIERKARKEHRCVWCGQKIEKNTLYFDRGYIFEGELKSDKIHLECKLGMENSSPDISEGFMSGQFERGYTDDGYDCMTMNHKEIFELRYKGL